MTEEGEEEARVFIEIFKSFPSIEEAKKVIPEQIDNILKELSTKEGFNIDDITFYYCPHISDKNLCGIYETRPGCCRRAPRHGWSVMPPGCGFEGWQFEQREKHKKTIRILKEYLYMAETLSEDGKVPGKEMTVEELRKFIESKIKPWERFGSQFW
jgi:Fe-S-cluster containining protein